MPCARRRAPQEPAAAGERREHDERDRERLHGLLRPDRCATRDRPGRARFTSIASRCACRARASPLTPSPVLRYATGPSASRTPHPPAPARRSRCRPVSTSPRNRMPGRSGAFVGVERDLHSRSCSDRPPTSARTLFAIAEVPPSCTSGSASSRSGPAGRPRPARLDSSTSPLPTILPSADDLQHGLLAHAGVADLLLLAAPVGRIDDRAPRAALLIVHPGRCSLCSSSTRRIDVLSGDRRAVGARRIRRGAPAGLVLRLGRARASRSCSSFSTSFCRPTRRDPRRRGLQSTPCARSPRPGDLQLLVAACERRVFALLVELLLRGVGLVLRSRGTYLLRRIERRRSARLPSTSTPSVGETRDLEVPDVARASAA